MPKYTQFWFYYLMPISGLTLIIEFFSGNDTVGMECPENYIKCPGDYCVPIQYICDGQWHCPDGEDEVSCPSMYTYGIYLNISDFILSCIAYLDKSNKYFIS